MVQCIGDFATKEGALEMLNAILGVAAGARDLLDAGRVSRTPEQLNAAIRDASAMLDDMINQSSTAERL